MGKKREAVRLSAGEMELMNMLWQEGPVTIADAHQVGYPTMQTRLNRLVDKGLATRSEERPARYKATVTVDQVAAGHLDQMLDRLTGTSVAPLVCHLISERPLTQQEISEVRELLSEAEGKAIRDDAMGD